MKIGSRVCWLLLALVLVTISLPRPGVAQQERVDLLMTLSGGYYNKVKAGEDNILFLELRNVGTKALTNIRLSAEGPVGWVIGFEPGVIGSLSAGSLQTVNIDIKPDSKAGKEDYRITLIAEANEIRKVSTIWVMVEAASFWLWVGIALAVVVVAVFVFIFLRFGRK